MLVAQIAVFLQRLADNLFELRRKIGIEPTGRHGGLAQDGLKDRRRAVAAKRERAGRHLVKHDAKGKQIRTRVQFLGPRLLRGHVRYCSQRAAWAGEMRLAKCGRAGLDRIGFAGDDFGQAEVQHFGASALGDEDVGRLDVAVDDAFAVSVVERIGDGDRNFE